MDNTIIQDIQSNLTDISPSNSQDYIANYDIQNLSFDSIYHDILDSIRSTIDVPLDLILSLSVCIIITALMQSISEIARSKRVYSLMSVLVCIRIALQPVVDSIENVKEVMLSSAMFMNSYVPILSSVMVANGQITTSASYGAITYVCCQVWIQFASSIILPLMSISLAISCISGICTEVSLNGIVKLIKKATHWIMTISMSIFSGIVTIQSAVSNSGDRITSKALKFVVSNGVPIVGSAISDACETVRSSLELLKAGIGLVGIVVILLNVLPPIVNVGVIRIVLTIGETLAEVFNVSCIGTFLSDVSSVMSAVFSCAVCFATTFIVSIGAVMLLVSV